MALDTGSKKSLLFSGGLWAAITAAWIAYEAYALSKNDDSHEPFTFYVRRAFNLKNMNGPLWWLLLGFWLWLGWHFFVEREK